MKQINSGIAGVALVTGASSGIGRALADELARLNYRVYAAARSLPDYFADPAAETVSGSGSLRPIRLDVTDEAAVREAFNQIIAAEGRLDCLIEAAGYGLAGSVEDTASSEARSQLETNFFGAIHILPQALAQMRRQKHGIIVFLGSVAGFLPIPFQAYYSASKAALTALSLALAEEVRPWGIRCLLVQPGDTQTGFTHSRVMAQAAGQTDYADRCGRSINRMAADEMRGTPAEVTARLVARQMLRRRPPLVYTPGGLYKLASVLIRILPLGLSRRIIGLMYAR
ncbi:MAG TPA: short-chain dehydrogenase [Clostridiales bacterium]|nr:short-chain dehydrogenase [Clostridiales bacterium]